MKIGDYVKSGDWIGICKGFRKELWSQELLKIKNKVAYIEMYALHEFRQVFFTRNYLLEELQVISEQEMIQAHIENWLKSATYTKDVNKSLEAIAAKYALEFPNQSLLEEEHLKHMLFTGVGVFKTDTHFIVANTETLERIKKYIKTLPSKIYCL